ncbi:MAG: hypothetical protein H6923_02285 [Alphaproteobacteria bacterium]|nr:hypothetical protein [Alphaproteobacteria bacterium]
MDTLLESLGRIAITLGLGIALFLLLRLGKQPAPEQAGFARRYRQGPLLRNAGIVSLVAAMACIWIGFEEPVSDPEEALWFLAVVTFLSVAGALMLLEARTEIRVAESYIERVTAWRGTRRLRWGEIARVQFVNWSDPPYAILWSKDRRAIRISAHFAGWQDILREAGERTGLSSPSPADKETDDV